MAKRSDLIAATARVLGDPPQSINVLAMELGKAKLIRVTGRGLSAADMQASDAVSLLTAAMVGGYATETGATTSFVLSAPYSQMNGGEGPKLSSGFDFEQHHTFGQAFEALLTAFVEDEAPFDTRTGKRIETVEIAVERLPAAYECRIRLVGGRYSDVKKWTVVYWIDKEEVSSSPRELYYSVAENLKKKYGRKSVTVAIDEGVLLEIGQLLRGEAQEVPDVA